MYLREVQNGEPLILTEHNLPIIEVRKFSDGSDGIVSPGRPFSSRVIDASKPRLCEWADLLDEERGR